jgi:excisionase family DNA binding protein
LSLHAAQGRLLTPKDVAELLGVPEGTLEFWRYQNRGPAYIKVGRHVRYRPADIEAYLQAQRRSAETG